MDPVRHLLIWLGVGAGHVALLVSLWGPGLTASGNSGDTVLELVWAEPDAVSASAPPAPLAQPLAVLAVSPQPITPSFGPRQEAKGERLPVTGSVGEPAAERGVPPSFVDRVEPVYPRGARLAGIEGVVRLSLEVNAVGGLRHAQVLVSSGDAALDRAALQAAEASTYRPAKAGGRNVEALVEASYRFELR